MRRLVHNPKKSPTIHGNTLQLDFLPSENSTLYVHLHKIFTSTTVLLTPPPNPTPSSSLPEPLPSYLSQHRSPHRPLRSHTASTCLAVSGRPVASLWSFSSLQQLISSQKSYLVISSRSYHLQSSSGCLPIFRLSTSSSIFIRRLIN